MSLITISSFTLPGDNLADGPYVLRLWYNQGFIDSSGQAVAPGTAISGTQFRFAATASSGVLTFDALEIYSTLDANTPYPQAINISSQVFKGSTGLPIFPFNQSACPASWIVPDDLGASITFETWTIANQRIVLTNPPQTFYTASEVDALLTSITYAPATTSSLGLVEISATPANPLLPIAVGKNDYSTTTNKGVVTLSVAPASATSPIAMGKNDYASSSNVGGTRLSTNPLSASAPIAYGINDTKQPASTDPIYYASQYASFNAAVTAIGSTSAVLIIDQLMTLVTTVSIPSTLVLQFIGAGVISLVDANTVTILGPVVAPVKQIFANATSGHGTVSFSGNLSVSTFYPQWWGAVADGSTDVTTHINASIAALNSRGRGVLYFIGSTTAYKITAALTTLTANCIVLGDGSGISTDLSSASFFGSKITSTSATANAFTVTALHVLFTHLAISNTAGSTPSAGAGIQVSGATSNQKVDYEDVAIEGFYRNWDIQVGFQWTAHNTSSISPVACGRRIQNTVAQDAGDWSISDSSDFQLQHDGAIAVQLLGAGGGKINNYKINGSGHFFDDGINASPAATGLLFINNTSIENITGYPVKIDGTGGGSGKAGFWHGIQINNLETYINPTVANTKVGIYLIKVNDFTLSNLNLGAQNSSLAAGIYLDACTNGAIDGDSIVIDGFGRPVQVATSYGGPLLPFEDTTALTVSANVITPLFQTSHLGAGLVKTITATMPVADRRAFTFTIIPDNTYTYDNTGNIVVPIGGGTAVVGKVMTFTYTPTTGKYYPSY